MNIIYIYHHLGMGDHILCNAIVRTYAEKHDRVFVFSKPHNSRNVSFMYRDLKNVKIIALDDAGVKFFMQMSPSNQYLVVGITPQWFHRFNVLKEFKTFDHGFYEVVNLPLSDKWDKFYVERNLEAEKDAFYNKLKLKDGEEFLFVHDDAERDRHFNSRYMKPGVKIIRPTEHKDVGLFDFIYTIEKAAEVHVMNSSFSCLIDTMQIKNDNLFYHEYARTDMGDNPNHSMKLNWKIIK